MSVPDRTAPESPQVKTAPTGQTEPTPQWRRALVSAGVTTALAVLVLVLGYERMRRDAEADAGVARTTTLKPAAASDEAGGSGDAKQAQVGQLAARPSP